MEGARCKVLPRIADHKGLLCTVPLVLPKTVVHKRVVWQYSNADWEGLKRTLELTDWSWLKDVGPNDGAQRLTDLILRLAKASIPQRVLCDRKSTHPWLNDRVAKLVESKHTAEGTAEEEECKRLCSTGIVEEFGKYVSRERKALQEMRRGAKAWWAGIWRLLQQKSAISSIPALRDSENRWVLDAKTKANLFVSTLSKKCQLGTTETNHYSELESSGYTPQRELSKVQVKHAEEVLKALREDSGANYKI